mmetsp:Transcript_4542/g.11439  ORF Transcript_4542/g.11439 Transcript_4542/m.11439 type:complete len:126 (+) Transcript_4542:212-589(+)
MIAHETGEPVPISDTKSVEDDKTKLINDRPEIKLRGSDKSEPAPSCEGPINNGLASTKQEQAVPGDVENQGQVDSHYAETSTWKEFIKKEQRRCEAILAEERQRSLVEPYYLEDYVLNSVLGIPL